MEVDLQDGDHHDYLQWDDDDNDAAMYDVLEDEDVQDLEFENENILLEAELEPAEPEPSLYITVVYNSYVQLWDVMCKCEM